MSRNWKNWVAGLGIACVVMGNAGKATAQSGEEWAAFGLGLAASIVNAASANQANQSYQGNSWGRAPTRHAVPNNSFGQMSGSMNLGNNNWFNTPNSAGNRPAQYGVNHYGPSYSSPNRNYYRTTPQYSSPRYSSPRYTTPSPSHVVYSSPSSTRPSYSAPSNVQLVSYESPSYQSPSYQNAAPTSAAPPAPKRVSSNKPITIRCPDDETGICSYSLISEGGAYNYTIEPGSAQTFQETELWKIRFDRGNGQGLQTYRLRGGQAYVIDRGPDGSWRMYKDQ